MIRRADSAPQRPAPRRLSFGPWLRLLGLALADGTRLAGRVWMPLERQSQRLSDFLNQLGSRFFVLITPAGTHFVNASAVVQVELDEGAGAPLGFPTHALSEGREHTNGAAGHSDHGASRPAAGDGTVS